MFLNDLVTKSIRGTEYRILVEPLIYETLDKYYYAVPAGFRTDFASIPKILRPWIDQDSGSIRDAAVLHDYLYSLAGTTGVSRLQCDNIFREAMTSLGMNWFKAWTAYSSVRLVGGSHFKRET